MTTVSFSNLSVLTGKQKRELDPSQEHSFFRVAAFSYFHCRETIVLVLFVSVLSQIPRWPWLFSLCWVGYRVEASVLVHACGHVVVSLAFWWTLVTFKLSTVQLESNTQWYVIRYVELDATLNDVLEGTCRISEWHLCSTTNTLSLLLSSNRIHSTREIPDRWQEDTEGPRVHIPPHQVSPHPATKCDPGAGPEPGQKIGELQQEEHPL